MDFERILSEERSRRVRGLSNSRALYINSPENLKEVGGQSLIVLCYAHWEGYFNYCVELYVKYVNGLDRLIRQINPSLLACEIEPYLLSLRDRNFKVNLRTEFARNMSKVMECRKITRSTSILKAASNLNFERLRACLDSLDIPEERFLPHRNFIEHELVKWRHQVAHGDEPILGEVDLVGHSHKSEELLLLTKEVFEDKLTSF